QLECFPAPPFCDVTSQSAQCERQSYFWELRLSHVKKSTYRPRFCLAAALAISAAVPIWAQSHPSITKSSKVTKDDGPQVTAGSSRTPDYQLDRSEEDWSGLCRQATGATTSGTGSSASGLDDHSGTSPSAQNYAARMRSTALTTGAAGRKIATAAT